MKFYFERYIIFLTLFMILLPVSLSINYFKYEYKDSSSSYVSNIIVRGFLCSDSLCLNQYVGDLWGGQSKSTNDATPNYDVVLSFPTSTEKPSNVNGYVFFSYSTSYLPMYSRVNPSPQLSGTEQSPIFSSTSGTKTLSKISSCSSPISVSVVNNNRENLPVSVTSGANMSSTTQAAFGFQSDVYNGFIQGSEFEQYYEIETTLRLKIYKYDSATSKNIGTPIHEENVVERIYYDDTVDVAFTDWMPPPQTDQFSYYNITVESDVTDQKCSSKINQRASKIMRVWRDDPRNECYSLIDTDGLVFSPVDFANRIPQTGQEVTLTFRKLSNYVEGHRDDVWIASPSRF